MTKNETVRLIGWIIPIMIGSIGGYLSFGQYSKFRSAENSVAEAKNDIRTEELNLATTQKEEDSQFFAVAPRSDYEQTLFLTDLRQRAMNAGVTLVRWSASTAPASGGKSEEDDVLKNIQRVSSTLSLEGDFSSLRAFIADINRSKRLYTASDITWTRVATDDIRLDLTVSRYVDGGTETEGASTLATLNEGGNSL